MRNPLGLLAGGQLSWKIFAELIGLLIPKVIPYALPLGLLTSVLLVLGKLSSQNEIVAMKASGMGLMRISSSIFFLAVIGCLGSLAINLYYGPNSSARYRQKLKNSIQKDPLNFIRPKVFIDDFPGYIMYADDRSGNDLANFWIWELDDKQRAVVFMKAQRGEFRHDPQHNAIKLSLINGSAEKRNSSDPENFQGDPPPTLIFEELSLTLSLDRIMAAAQVSKKMSNMNIFELLDARKAVINDVKLKPEDAFQKQVAFQTQIQKNLASCFSILALTTLGIPLGIKISRRETYANLAVALGLALSYYLFVIMITWLEQKPHLRPDLLVWVPNLIFEGIGITLFVKACRH